MDSEGYPTEDELNKIKTWDVKDFPALLDFITDLHAYPNYLKREVAKDILDTPVLRWVFCTAGWSGNESLIYALLENIMFRIMWYESWQRGGKYVFLINPKNVGFKTVSEYCKENKVCRQYISKAKDKFDWFKLSPKKRFIRKKELCQKK